MGIEVKVEVTPPDIAGAFRGDNRAFFLERASHPSLGPQPNILYDPFTGANVAFSVDEHTLFQDVLIQALGQEGYSQLQSSLSAYKPTVEALFYNFLVANSDDTPLLERLATALHRQLETFATAHERVKALHVNPADLINVNLEKDNPFAKLIAGKSDRGVGLTATYWTEGVEGLAGTVVVSNRLYGPEKASLLSRMSNGAIEPGFLSELRSAYSARISP